MAKLYNPEDMHWKEWHTNNIPSNPMGEYYCILDNGNYARKYSIVPQYPSEDGICVDCTKEPEYYILFESRGRRATIEDKKTMFYSQTNYDGYLFDQPSFIRVFKTLQEAKQRAHYQYVAIYGYVASHLDGDVGKGHFFVD